jgi:hypothetical protein
MRDTRVGFPEEMAEPRHEGQPMSDDMGGWLWLVVVGLIALLVVALSYGTVAWRRGRASPVSEQAREDAIRRLYRDEAERERQRSVP